MIDRNGTRIGLTTAAALAAALAAGHAAAATDGFGDADRNNDGAITPYDTDVDLSGAIDGAELTAPEDAGDTGLIWVATRGFTSSNTGDPKANIKILDDSAGDVDSPGIGSGYALGAEAKGSGSSFVGFLNESIALGPNVGDKVAVSVDFRVWSQSNNATPAPPISELRWGVFQNTDNQFGQTNNEGLDTGSGQAEVVWGPDTGENDGDWRDADPGPVGDKGYWWKLPVGASADPEEARLVYEANGAVSNKRFLEGSEGDDIETVAAAPGDGPGVAITDSLLPHTLQLEIVRTATTIELVGLVDGVEAIRDEIDLGTDDVAALGAPPESFDYIAFRNTGTFGDWDFIIDNVNIEAVPIPEPASLALLGLGGLAGLVRRRR